MERRFEGRVALVRGAASGIGRAAALRLATEGAQVALVDRDAAGVQATLRELGARGGKGQACTADVSSSAAVEKLAARVAAELGPVDVLANVAGIGDTASRAGIAAIDDARWERVLAVNLGKPFFLCRALLPGMAERGRGAVVNVSSLEERPRRRRLLGEEEAEARRERTAAYPWLMPIKRLSTPDGQAAAIAFLASEEASYINGVSLDVNGGLFMA
jgi:NAD(P)-dependent dehydrogenase (short-subunit alcohol dehydrogenase family)